MAKTSARARYAHQKGRHFEDFIVGDIYHHLPGRTISQQDNAWFTLLTMNTHPNNHCNGERAGYQWPAELGLGGIFFIKMQRVSVHGEQGKPGVILLGNRPAG
jgi:acyl dehydratase